MSGYADTGDGGEYSRLFILSTYPWSMIKNGRKKVTLVCLGIKNEIIHSMPFCDTYLKNRRFLIFLFGTNLKFLNSIRLQKLE